MEIADDYNLYIKTLFVDGGPMLKRFRPAPQGRAQRIRKRRNHVTLIVENRILLDRDTTEKGEEEYISQEGDDVEIEEIATE